MVNNCPECYNNEIKFWREQPMNEEIRKNVTYQRHANMYYYTLDEAMAIWGTQIEEVTSDILEAKEHQSG